MDARTRDRIAVGVGATVLVVALAVLMLGRVDPGVRIALDGEQIVITEVNEHSVARTQGLQPGMILTELNGVALIRFPEYVYPEIPPTPDPETGEYQDPQPIGIEPTEPTAVPITPEDLATLASGPVERLQAIQPWELDRGSVVNGWNVNGIFDDGRYTLRDAMASVFLGAAILFVAGWWLASGRGGAGLKPLAVPLAVAIATPFILRPLDATWSPPIIALGGVLLPVGMVPLAIGLRDRIADAQERRLVAQATAACLVGALVVGIGLAVTEPWSGAGVARWVLVGAVPLIPGLAAAGHPARRPVRRGQ